MATLNIPRDVSDPFYRYKMERLQSKIEGKGNGIKTVVVNLSSVAQSLARPPSYLIKYFGFELGAQTNIDPADDRWIINGAHEASKLQDYLDGFIKKFVLCQQCRNPETDVKIKDEIITLDCKACGSRSTVDPRAKLSSFIIKHQPKKGKKDKSTKKAERKARKERERNGEVEETNGENGNNSEGSPDGSNNNSDHGDENGEVEVEAGSDDELTRRINAEAKDIEEADEDKEVQWTVDISEKAQKARAEQLSNDLKKNLVLNGDGDDEDGESSPYGELGNWIDEQAKQLGGVSKVDDVDIYQKAKALGIEKKHKTLVVLAQSIFDDNIVKQIKPRAGMLKTMISSERHEKALLGGTERLVGMERPHLIPQVSAILNQYYTHDLLSEEVIIEWGSKASKKYVDNISTSKKVRKSAEKFITALQAADSDEESDDE